MTAHVTAYARVVADTDGGSCAFVVTNPPTGPDLDRWQAIASQPGLVGATWHAEPSTSHEVRPRDEVTP